MNIEKLRLETEENNYCNASGSNQYKKPVQSNVSDIKLYDMSFSTFIFTIPPLILSAPISLLFSFFVQSHCRLCEFWVCRGAYQTWRAGWLITWCQKEPSHPTLWSSCTMYVSRKVNSEQSLYLYLLVFLCSEWICHCKVKIQPLNMISGLIFFTKLCLFLPLSS